jgi:restriction system protein
VQYVLDFVDIFWHYMPWSVGVSILLLLLINVKRRQSRHKFKIKMASKALDKLREINSPAMQFSYIRKIDPYVFEEMILTALSRRGHRITRSRSYSGDGGVDGEVVINGNRVLIQAKRYSGYIKSVHVEHFHKLCEKEKNDGLFVHSGKTGKKAKESSRKNLVEIVSGRKLLMLLTEGERA